MIQIKLINLSVEVINQVAGRNELVTSGHAYLLEPAVATLSYRSSSTVVYVRIEKT